MNDAKLLPWLVLKKCGSVWGAHCTCMAGLGECCSHVGALLFYLQFVVLKKSENGKSVTDVSAYWVIPSNQHADPKRIREINFDCPKSMLPQNPKKNSKSKSDFTKKLKKTLNDPQEFKNFLSNLEKVNSNAAILRVVEPFNLKFVYNEFPKSLANLYKDEYSILNLEELVCVGSQLDFSLTLEDCSSIEISTKMQAKTQNWFLYRTGRITASRVKDVCSVKSSYSNKSLLKSICYPLKNTFKSIATEWGINHEEKAKASYMEKNKNHHINFSMNNSGLVINPSLPYLGASPDGIINCDCCGKGCLEIKCPHTLSEGGETRSMSYLFNGHLSKNHQYYYQLQTQILLCGTQYGDFVVWSPNECYIERINIDPDIQEEILNKSKWFYYESILPKLLGRHFSNTEIKPIETYDETLTYENCVCKKNTGGKMIMCTKEGCPNLWYHYSCLGIKRKPSTKTWKCALCQ